MKQKSLAYIVAAKRTPVGKAPRGVFKHTRPDDLLSTVISGTLSKVDAFDPQLIDDIIIGCAMPEGAQGMNVARIALLLAGLPDTVPGMTINRFCASGLQAIANAAERIASGAADCIIAGGTESMSMVPLGGNDLSANPKYFANGNAELAIAYGMGITAEKVAQKYNISREAQDEFALMSHQRALSALQNNAFNDEIVPVDINLAFPKLAQHEITAQTLTISQDEGPRADTSIERLNALRSVFNAKGSVTAGNSSQMSDGAAAVLVVSEQFLKQHNLTPIAAFKAYAVAGVAPEYMGIGPTVAIPKVLKMAGLTINDLDWIELNEAFAAQALAVINELALDQAKVNPHGGAIALGHPLGATGAIRTATLLNGMRKKQQKYGMVTMCVGAGQGAAGIFERL